MTPRLLILRPQPGAGVTAARAAALGLDAIVAPLFAIEPVAWAPPGAGGYDAVMMTSANAARMGGEGLDAWRGHRLYVVGEATAAAARTAGFGDIVVGPTDAAALIAQARADGVGRLLHFAGADHVAVDDADIDRVIVYTSVDRVPPELGDLADENLVALVHSARAARRFATLAPDRSRIAIAAISAASAAAASDGWRALDVADRPTDGALLAVAARLCDEWGQND